MFMTSQVMPNVVGAKPVRSDYSVCSQWVMSSGRSVVLVVQLNVSLSKPRSNSKDFLPGHARILMQKQDGE